MPESVPVDDAEAAEAIVDGRQVVAEQLLRSDGREG